MEQTAREVARNRQTEQDNDSTLSARLAAALAKLTGKVDAASATLTAVGGEGGQLNLDPPAVGGHGGWSIDVDSAGDLRLISEGQVHARFAQDTGWVQLKTPHATAALNGVVGVPAGTGFAAATTFRLFWTPSAVNGVTYTSGTGLFTVQQPGIWRVSANAAFSFVVNDCRLNLFRDVSGVVTNIDADERREAFQSYTHCRVGWRGQLNTGDGVYVDGWAGDAGDLPSDGRQHFTMERVFQ